jgi:membrane-associated phospholipid phosphatase
LITGIFIIANFDKGQFELWFNRQHQPAFDYFFFYITYLGDGIGSTILVILLLLRRIYYGILAALSVIVSTIIAQGMKRLMFHDFPRPVKFFQKKVELHLIDGLEIHEFYSFPSGHSSGAFAVFILLCLISKNKIWSLCYFTLALMVALSRVYLMQHFFIDTFFGAIIGTLSAVFVYFYIEYKSSLPQMDRIQRPLLKIFDKE